LGKETIRNTKEKQWENKGKTKEQKEHELTQMIK
jgi:hypothetical protein